MPKESPGSASAPTTQKAGSSKTEKPPRVSASQQKERRDMSQVLKNAYYAIWSVIGLIVIVMFAVAVFGSGSWVENLNIASETPAAEQPPAAQPQQPPQPTEEQLDCVRKEVGEERFNELEQGDAANEEENGIIQECLQG